MGFFFSHNQHYGIITTSQKCIYYLELFLKWVMWLMGILFFYLGMWTGLPPYQNAEFLSGLHWPSEHFRSDPPSLSRGLSSTPRKVLALDLARAATVYKFMEEICLSVNVQYLVLRNHHCLWGKQIFRDFMDFPYQWVDIPTNL